MKKIAYLIFTLLMTLSGCRSISQLFQPDKFSLNIDTNPISCFILSEFDNVQKVANNAIILHKNGAVSLRNRGLTQQLADFTVDIRSGKGIKFAFRTNTLNYPEHPAINFEYTNEGCFIIENNKVIFENKDVKANLFEPTRIKIINDGDDVAIVIDCEVLKLFKTNLKSTEYIILENIENSETYISGIKFSYIINDEDYNQILRDKNPLSPQ